ncbi:hypothetical protein J6590_060378 [Homalodisca vitripennis]|nr:hypothetical protein J6590_060378 [Homalodisca vitripennis]
MLGRRERRRQRREAQQQENNSSGKKIVKTVMKTVFMPHNAVTTTIRCAKLGVKVVSKFAGSHEDVSSHEPEHPITSSQHISKSTPDLRPTCPNWTSSSPSPNMCPPQDFTSSTMMTFPHSSTRALSPNTASSSSPAYWGVTDPLPNVSSTASSTRSNSPSVPPNTPYEPVSNPFAGPYLHPMALATYYEN